MESAVRADACEQPPSHSPSNGRSTASPGAGGGGGGSGVSHGKRKKATQARPSHQRFWPQSLSQIPVRALTLILSTVRRNVQYSTGVRSLPSAER